MPVTRRGYLLRHTMAGTVINLALHAAVGWLVYRGMVSVPHSGPKSIAGDVTATAFLLPLLVCLIVTPLVRGEVRKGVAAPAPASGPLARLLPRMLLARGAVLGILAAAAIGLPTAWALENAGVQAMSFGSFVAFKAGFAALLAALITPLVAWRALMDRSGI